MEETRGIGDACYVLNDIWHVLDGSTYMGAAHGFALYPSDNSDNLMR